MSSIMQQLSFSSISLDAIKMPLSNAGNIPVSVLRLDKMHEIISGNKWFKLRFYIDEALALQKRSIVTFGGAYSNHIVATAALSQLHGLRSAGIIRGEKPLTLSPTLKNAEEYGMELIFVTRQEYGAKMIPSSLTGQEFYYINEGGYGALGARGASTIAEYFNGHGFTHICCAVGTTTMMAGLVNASSSSQHVVGISVMKNNPELEPALRQLLNHEKSNYTLFHDYHFSGYGRHQPGLIRFMNEFFSHTGIPTDFVYTGKLFHAINDLLENKFFPTGSRLLVIHSGGLQGNNSLKKGTLIF